MNSTFWREIRGLQLLRHQLHLRPCSGMASVEYFSTCTRTPQKLDDETKIGKGINDKTYPELRVLSICEIEEFGTFLLRLEIGPICVSLPIHGDIVQLEQNREDDGNRDGGHNGHLGGNIVGCILVPEGQGTEDVAQTEGHQQDGVHRDLLRVAGNVRPDDRIDQWIGRGDKIGHVVPRQFGGSHVRARKRQQTGSEKTANQHSNDGETALIVFASEVCGKKDHAHTDHTPGNGEKLRLLGGEAKTLDDLRRKATNCAIGDIDGGHNNGDQVGLWIFEDLEDLFLLEVFVFNSGPVLAEPINGPDLLFRAQTGRHGIVREKEEDADSNRNGDQAKDQEHQLPGKKSIGFVEEKSKCNQGAHDLSGPRP